MKILFEIILFSVLITTISTKSNAQIFEKFKNQKDSVCLEIDKYLNPILDTFFENLNIKKEKFLVFYNSSGHFIIFYEQNNVLYECFVSLNPKREFVCQKSRLKKMFLEILQSKKRNFKISSCNNGGNICFLKIFDGFQNESYCFNILSDYIPIEREYYREIVNRMFYYLQ